MAIADYVNAIDYLRLRKLISVMEIIFKSKRSDFLSSLSLLWLVIQTFGKECNEKAIKSHRL